jgi:hypothetical protein
MIFVSHWLWVEYPSIYETFRVNAPVS